MPHRAGRIVSLGKKKLNPRVPGFGLVTQIARTILFPLMLFLAASALEKAAEVPSGFWLKLIFLFVGFVAAVLLLRWLAQQNRVLMLIVGVVGAAILGFSWIYERNEPEILTPAVDAIAPFFPSKGAYDDKQQQDASAPGLKKNSPRPTPTKR